MINTHLLLSILTFWIPIALIAGRLYGMQMRHVRYLQDQVRVLGGEDWWNDRCTHCGRLMRDAASTRQTTRFPSGSGSGWQERTDGVFHLDRPACLAAADRMADGQVGR
ncbi:hypothetical protein [Streptomyces sp. NPDC060001]|uniref:hypothetical protein n=1 Tax=Streptomyces sp. NPDC060001 TaxID=3347032 RepID=UPI0036C4FBD5